MKNFLKRIAVFIIGLSSFVVGVYLLFNDTNEAYSFLFLLPIVYAICFFLFLSPSLFYKRSLFRLVFLPITYIRYTILPLFICLSSYYYGRAYIPPRDSSVKLAIFLMIVEILSCSIAYYLFQRKTETVFSSFDTNDTLDMSLADSNNLFYLIFIAFSFLLFFVIPGVSADLNIVIPKEDIERNVYKDATVLYSLGVYCFTVSKQLLFLLLTKSLAKRYRQKKNVFFLFAALLLAVLNTVTYYSSARIDILITAIASISIVAFLFRVKNRWLLYVGMAVLVVFILISISIIRQTQFISNGNTIVSDVADMISVYCGGPYNVAMAVETAIDIPESRKFVVLLGDIFRPMLGISFIMKFLNVKYSNYYYNLRFFNGNRFTQIIPMIGEGYLFFGFLFSPIVEVAFLCSTSFFQKEYSKTHSVEVKYFLSLIIVRLGFMMGQNIMNLVNYMSINLFLFLIVYSINKRLTFRKKKVPK